MTIPAIYTVTPNPGLDRTLTVDQIVFDEVLRAQSLRLDWGGKGFNVARVLKTLGIPSMVLGFIGGATGQRMVEGLHDLGIQTDFVTIAEETRTNTVFLETASSRYIKVNEIGPTVQPEEVQALLLKAESLAQLDSLWVLAGSLPAGVSDDYYRQMIDRLNRRGARVCLDTSGEALRLGCEAQPFLIKPNASEAAELTGQPVNDPLQAVTAARTILRLGIPRVVISLGGQGILVAGDEQAVLARLPEVPVKAVTGAGDATMAGLLWALERGGDLAEMARSGAALGTASVMHTGVAEINLADVYQVYAQVQLETYSI